MLALGARYFRLLAAAVLLSILVFAGARSEDIIDTDAALGDVSTINLSVNRIEQETMYYCGPAVSLMFMKFFTQTAEHPQSALYLAIRDRNLEPDSFFSDPAGIASVVNDHIQGVAGFNVIDMMIDRQDDAVAMVVATLSEKKRPLIALVRSGMHWVIIDGARFITIDGERLLAGFLVTDPARDYPGRRYIPMTELMRSFLTPNALGEHWKGQVVLISDDAASPQGAPQAPFGFLPTGGGGSAPDANRSLEQISSDLLRRQGFSTLQPLPGGGSAGSQRLHVEDLDADRFYDVVSLDATNDPVFADVVGVAIDPLNMEILEMSDGSTRVGDDAWANSMVDRAVATNIITGTAITVTDRYVWSARLYLRSMTHPARVVTVDGIDWFLLPDGSVVSGSVNPGQPPIGGM